MNEFSGAKLNVFSFLFFILVGLYVFQFIFMGRFPYNVLPLIVGIPAALFLFLFHRWAWSKAAFIQFSLLVCFCILALLYLIYESGFAIVLSQEFFFFVSLPLMYYASYRLLESGKGAFLVKMFLCFLCLQIFVMLGQFSKNAFGVGFNLPSDYIPD